MTFESVTDLSVVLVTLILLWKQFSLGVKFSTDYAAQIFAYTQFWDLHKCVTVSTVDDVQFGKIPQCCTKSLSNYVSVGENPKSSDSKSPAVLPGAGVRCPPHARC